MNIVFIVAIVDTLRRFKVCLRLQIQIVVDAVTVDEVRFLAVLHIVIDVVFNVVHRVHVQGLVIERAQYVLKVGDMVPVPLDSFVQLVRTVNFILNNNNPQIRLQQL